MAYTIDPNTGIRIPIPGTAEDYGDDISNALTTLSGLRHTGAPNDGLQLGTASINVDADVAINGHNITNTRALRLAIQSTAPSGVGDVGQLTNVNGDAVWINSSGTAVQITSGTQVNVGASSNTVLAYTAPGGSITIANTDAFIFVSIDTTAARTVTMPAANSVTAGRQYFIKDRTGSGAANNITLVRAGSDTFDGASSFVINSNYGSAIVTSNGATGWNVIRLSPGNAASGDLSGTFDSPTVAKIQGNAVSSSTNGASQDGYVLTWVNGSSNYQAKAPAPVNMAGGSTSVTGTLPTANQASQTLSGDVTGTTASNTVAKINAATVPAAGSLTTGNGLHVSGSSALTYSALNLAGGAGFVTGVLPIANQAAQTMTGDVTGNTGANAVAKINSASVPAAGSLTTGNGLYVTGASALTYSALNLAGGAGFVTGLLPTANQAAQSHGGDLGGTTAAATVLSITGSAGVVSIATAANAFTWVVGATPSLVQTDNTTAGATGKNMTIHAQNATGTGLAQGGSLILSPGTGTNINGYLTLQNIITATSAFGAGGASALPATPLGYMRIALNGIGVVAIPYWAA